MNDGRAAIDWRRKRLPAADRLRGKPELAASRLEAGRQRLALLYQGMTCPPFAINRLAPLRLSKRAMPHHLGGCCYLFGLPPASECAEMSKLVEMVARGAVTDRASDILEGIVASIRRASGLSDARIDAGDMLDQFRMGRLRLLGVLIELEDEFCIEFPVDAVDRFRRVGDIALYIQSHEMAPEDDVPAEWTSALTIWRRSARDLLHRAFVCVFSNPFKSAGLASYRLSAMNQCVDIPRSGPNGRVGGSSEQLFRRIGV